MPAETSGENCPRFRVGMRGYTAVELNRGENAPIGESKRGTDRAGELAAGSGCDRGPDSARKPDHDRRPNALATRIGEGF